MIQTDVCIVGAGPAGATAALFLNKFQIPTVLIDKATFPRHKTCGEAMRGNISLMLNRLNPDYMPFLVNQGILHCSPKINLIAANGRDMFINLGETHSFLGKRFEFDDFLLKEAKKGKFLQVIDNQEVRQIFRTENGFLITDPRTDFKVQTKILLLATGGQSPFIRQFFERAAQETETVLGVRAYFKNVRFDHFNSTKIFFLKSLQGGYLWVFSLPNNNANVGLAMRSDKVKASKINLRSLFEEVIQDPLVQPFFENAEIDGNLQGATLHLPQKRQPLSDERLLLVGDSGLSINPITGYGVGHAMTMGRYAAEQTREALANRDFSAKFLKKYDQKIYQVLSNEILAGRIYTQLLNHPKLLNGLISTFAKNERFRNLFDREDLARNSHKPSYYLKNLLFPTMN